MAERKSLPPQHRTILNDLLEIKFNNTESNRPADLLTR